VGDSSGGVSTAALPQRARAARSVRAGEGGAGSLTHETQPATQERGRREARGLTQERNGVGRAQMNSYILDLFKRISN
jgi:hypothetical protein